jgi:pimeloyl-ACP methyl ester carboxylesterase
MLKFLTIVAGVLALAVPAMAQTADPNRLFADSTVVVRDRFSDEIVGKGPDLVFIPGLASSRATWKATAERLRDRYRVHLIQVAGFAGEPARANATGEVVVPTAEAIGAYLEEQKLAPATMIGHSLGGTMLLYLAETHPERLKRAMVVDALPFFGGLRDPNATADSIRPAAAKMRDMMLASTGTKMTAEMLEPQEAAMSKDQATRHMIAEWGVASDRSVVARAMYEDMVLDLRPGLAAIRTPITLIHPDNTPLGVPAGMMEKVYTRLYAPAQTVKTQVVENAQHFVMLDQPQAFAAALDSFLAGER